jgi:hypothetical protein
MMDGVYEPKMMNDDVMSLIDSKVLHLGLLIIMQMHPLSDP